MVVGNLSNNSEKSKLRDVVKKRVKIARLIISVIFIFYSVEENKFYSSTIADRYIHFEI